MADPNNQSIAAQYMNPYLAQSLTPQLNLLAQQAQTNEQSDLGKLTSQGAFGGSRQAVLQGMDQNALLGQQANLIGQGYNTAYNNAQNQFNTEQTQGQNLANTIGGIGAQQQALSQADVAAQQAQYQTEQAYPYQQLQFEQGLLNGLPVASVTSTPNALSGIGSVLAGASALNNTSVQSLLKNLGVPGF
jgi:phosphoglycolate phosphatase-like HAD superfamily hydrolase